MIKIFICLISFLLVGCGPITEEIGPDGIELIIPMGINAHPHP